MRQLWARVLIKQRIERSEVETMEGDVQGALHALCARMDIPRPLWLKKHEREWTQFGLTAFTQEHFVEPVFFEKMEIERIESNAPKRKSQDPRNG